ncbi:MAG: hypothetical protein H7Z75_01035 [Ferruginibacter sp.]|nr:hypothetical protein [Cytophagales bacterium]
MKNLTIPGRILITLLFVGFLYGIKWLVLDSGYVLNKEANRPEVTQQNGAPYAPPSESNAPAATATPVNQTQPGFNYAPPAVANGKLKGVVELGASGFNSFIIKVDDQRNWKLEKSEFGNSLVLENMATDDDIRAGLKKYIGGMLDFGVSGKDIHFVVSSGAAKAENTNKISRALKQLNYVVNQVTPEQEGTLGLKTVLPDAYAQNAFVADIGSGNTKISWMENGKVTALESYGSKYFQDQIDGQKVYEAVSAKVKQIPQAHRATCFIIGGIPFEMAKEVRQGKERYTVLKAPGAYQLENAKSKAGINIYKAIADGTGCQQFVFDWDANFTIGFLLDLPL